MSTPTLSCSGTSIPVGIWRPVRLKLHDVLREAAVPAVAVALSGDHREAHVRFVWSIFNEGSAREVHYTVRVHLQDAKRVVVSRMRSVRLQSGANTLADEAVIDAPKLWTTWDRGQQPLYEADLELAPDHGAKLRAATIFGVRRVELHRSKEETRFFLNGEPIYLRGTTYWPDLYLSNMTQERCERYLRQRSTPV